MLMELIERYIYAVTQRLPHAQREDIAKELRSLIEDMLEERVVGRSVTKQDVEDVLLEIGHPKQLAEKYRETKKYIIGPELYESFMTVLKIVLISVAFGLGISFTIKTILDPMSILDHFVGFIVSLVSALPAAFGWTTLGFAIIESTSRIQSKQTRMETKWHPSNLPPVPDQKNQIKRSEPIVGIAFYVWFAVILAFINEHFGVWVFRNGTSDVVPFLNLETIGNYWYLLVILFGFGIVKEALKLLEGKWTMRLVIFTTIANFITMIAVISVIVSPTFWNPNFMQQLVQADLLIEGSEAYNWVRIVWDQATIWVLIGLIFTLIWDAVNGLLKARSNSSSVHIQK